MVWNTRRLRQKKLPFFASSEPAKNWRRYDLFLNSQSILLFTEVTQYCYHGCFTKMTRWYCFSNTSANLEAMRKEIHYKSYELYLFSSKKLSLDRRPYRKVSLTCRWQQDSWPPSTRVKWYTFTSTFSWIYNVS